MKFEFLDRRSAERFAELLDEAGGARRHHTRGSADEELNRLVAIGNRLGAARPGAPVDAEFRVGLRAMLVATAERDGIGRTAIDDSGPVPDIADGRRSFFGRRIRARGAIVIGVAAGAMAVSGISAASESASPGDALYGVKRSTERAQLAIAGSDVSRGQLSLDFARNRLTEAVAMDGEDPAFRTVLDDMDADTRKGVRLLNTSAVTNSDVKPLTTLGGFVTAQRRAFEPAVQQLSPANRDRAAASLALLQDVADRTELLRAGLACEKVTPGGSDELGPKLRDCRGDDDAAVDVGTPTKPGSATSGGGKAPGKKHDRDATPKPAKSGATTKPAVTGGTTPPGGTTAPTAPINIPPQTRMQSSAPTVTVTPPPVVDDRGQEQGGSVLDGLLNDLF